jgi:hypothetical protein
MYKVIGRKLIKVVDWLLKAIGVAILLSTIWLVHTDGSINILANHIGDWGAILVAIGIIICAFWLFGGDWKDMN